jgi:hypothetical protein
MISKARGNHLFQVRDHDVMRKLERGKRVFPSATFVTSITACLLARFGEYRAFKKVPHFDRSFRAIRVFCVTFEELKECSLGVCSPVTGRDTLPI